MRSRMDVHDKNGAFQIAQKRSRIVHAHKSQYGCFPLCRKAKNSFEISSTRVLKYAVMLLSSSPSSRKAVIALIAVAFDFCTRRNCFADNLLRCFACDVFDDLHLREHRCPVFRFLRFWVCPSCDHVCRCALLRLRSRHPAQ